MRVVADAISWAKTESNTECEGPRAGAEIDQDTDDLGIGSWEESSGSGSQLIWGLTNGDFALCANVKSGGEIFAFHRQVTFPS